MKKFRFTINGISYEVDIISDTDGFAIVEVNGVTYKVGLEGNIPIPQQQALKVSQPEKPTPAVIPQPIFEQPVIIEQATIQNESTPIEGSSIHCPLPGVILDILVKTGDSVKAGQKLFVLEAMKMENDINADRDGKVIAIHVQKGDSVMEGDVLIEIG
jgi:glutaconyl-CoA/methylmalonyl-CoA decarboxylase subunit gamma